MVKQMSHSDPEHYDKPELRDRIKAEITAGDKGGKPAQWSARKAQLVTREYEKQGGGYKQPPDAEQQSLKEWGDEKWRTADGKKAVRKGGTARYLPEEAWKSLSSEEQQATDKKKKRGSAEGQQYVANTAKAASARKKASGADQAPGKKKPAKKAPATAKKAAAGTPSKSTRARKKSASSKSAAKEA